MRALPEEAGAIWRPTPGLHPRRPWWAQTGPGDGWGRSGVPYGTGYDWILGRRPDLPGITPPASRRWAASPFRPPRGAALADIAGSDAEACMAAVDAAYPLAPPELRSGQVWMLQLKHGGLLTTHLLDRPLHASPGWILGGERIGGARDLLLKSAGPYYAWLMRDPLDPTAPPWTGAREAPP